MNTEIDRLMRKNDELFDELEFWKSVAIEHNVPEDAYDCLLADVDRMFEEIDPYNTGEIHG